MQFMESQQKTTTNTLIKQPSSLAIIQEKHYEGEELEQHRTGKNEQIFADKKQQELQIPKGINFNSSKKPSNRYHIKQSIKIKTRAKSQIQNLRKVSKYSKNSLDKSSNNRIRIKSQNSIRPFELESLLIEKIQQDNFLRRINKEKQQVYIKKTVLVGKLKALNKQLQKITQFKLKSVQKNGKQLRYQHQQIKLSKENIKLPKLNGRNNIYKANKHQQSQSNINSVCQSTVQEFSKKKKQQKEQCEQISIFSNVSLTNKRQKLKKKLLKSRETNKQQAFEKVHQIENRIKKRQQNDAKMLQHICLQCSSSKESISAYQSITKRL